MKLFFIIILISLAYADLQHNNYDNLCGTVYVTLDFEGKITDSIPLTKDEINSIFNGISLVNVSYSGACDYLCGSSGIFAKIFINRDFITNKNEGYFIIDFGYECNKTNEICIDLKGNDQSATFIYSYNSKIENWLKNIWEKTKKRNKSRLKDK